MSIQFLRAAAAVAGVLATAACSRPARIYVGTYTSTMNSRGIYRIDFDQRSGRFTSEAVLAAEAENPSFLAVSPDGRFVLAVNEQWRFNNERTGAVSAFSVHPVTGALSLINQAPSGGVNPCFVALDTAGRHAIVANYTSGTVAVLPVDEDGRLGSPSMVRGGAGSGPVRDRQDGPHAHHAVFDLSNRFVLWTDLGADWVAVDRYDATTGKLEPANPPGIRLPPGSGPRHLVWHPSGRVAYLLNELSATITSLTFDPNSGALGIGTSISARRADASGKNTSAEIVMPRHGHFLYASNRGDDDVAVFRVDPLNLELVLIAHVSAGGRTPRHIALDPDGRWLIVANQDSNSLVVFEIDPATGIPAPTGVTASVPVPVNVLFTSPR